MTSLTPGTPVGSYEIVSEIGRGGMATVYRAYQHSLDRFVALKVLHISEATHPTSYERFRQEARLIARLHHPNIVQVYDLAEHDGQLFLAMELIEGTSLREQMTGDLAPQRALAVVSQVAAALDAAHANGIVHRDVKPSNVLQGADGRLLLSDFGIARLMEADTALTGAQSALGTPDYMSPEQASGQPVGPATDIYALGVMAFELLTGRVPFGGDTPFAVLRAHLQDPPPPASSLNPSLPVGVDAVLARALAKAPADRYASALQLAMALRSALEANAGLTEDTVDRQFVQAPTAGPSRQASSARVTPPIHEIPQLPVQTKGPRARPIVLAAGMGLAVVALLVAGLSGMFTAGSPAGARNTAPTAGAGAVQPPMTGTTTAVSTSTDSGESAAQSAGAAPAGQRTAPSAVPTAVPPTPLPSVAPTAIAVDPNPPVRMLTGRDGYTFSNLVTPKDVAGLVLSTLSIGPGQVRVYASDLTTLRLHSWRIDPAGQWQAENTQVHGAPSGMIYGTVLPLADGTYRLYYLAQNGPVNRSGTGPRDILLDGLVLSARSKDGINFDQEPGVRLARPGMSSLTATQVNNEWLLLYKTVGSTSVAGARSADGLTFSGDANVSLPGGWSPVTDYDGQWHFLRYAGGGGAPRQLLLYNSSDSVAWTMDRALDVSFQSGTGPASVLIMRSSDGLYRMFYSWATLPPQGTGGQPAKGS